MASILIVDDRALNREFLKTLLGYAGYAVLEAADGAEALESVRRRHPDLVISDVLMPTMDGIEFAKQLHADPAIASIPIIFYTATYRLSEAQALAQSCGVAGVIGKPAEPQAILDTVAATLGIDPAAANTPAAASESLEPVGNMLPSYLRELSELQQRLQQALNEGLELVGKGGALNQMSERLVHSYATVQTLSLRLAALLELSLALPAERDPQQLLDLFCRAAQGIMNAKYTVVGVGADNRRLQRCAARGMTDAERAAVFDALDPGAGVLGEVLAGSKPRRVHDLEGNALTLGLPSSHPPIRTFLIVPVMSGPQPDGWLYFADKLGADAFSDSDEQFAVMLAAQLAPAYENLVLYDEIRQHAGQLRQEIEARQRALTELTESELRFRQLAENIREVFFLTDPINGRALYVSPAYEDIWGCSCESLYTRPQSWLEAVHPDDRQQVSEVTESINTTGRFQMTYRIIRPDGAICWIRTRGFPIRDATGKLYRIAGLSEDITEHQEQQEKIARLSRIYAVLSGINSAIVRIRDRSEIFREACRIAVTEGLFKMAWIGTIDPDTLDGEVVTWFGDEKRYIFSDFRLTARADTPYSDWPACRAVREMKPVITNHVGAEPSLAPIKTDLLERGILSIAALPLIVGKRTAAALVLYAAEADFFTAEELKLLNELAGDIAFSLEFIEKEEKLSYLAYYDVLTGLANSTLFHDRLTQLLNGPRRAMHIIAVLLIDLDRFTQLNDTLGRHAGDALLKAVAERLKDTLPDPNGLARISADTFAVALTGLQQGTDAALILQDRIFEPLKQVFTVDGDEVRLSARAGIALCPGDGEDASTLFKNAEAALKQAQSSGERLLYYAPEINAKVAQKLTLESKLRTALEHEQFVLHYQPKLDARDGRLSGFEALIRWQDPDAGLVPPGQFIPLLEETGLILEVGWWALEKALSDYRRWHDAGMQVPPIAVNVSAVQLQQRNFASLVRRAIDSSSAGPKALELEITESLIMADIETNIETLRQISDMGVTIAIDDFGTGYSSLRYLAKLPVHSLKIDRSFIITMINDPNSMTIVSTVISLAHALALKVVAEGVDSEEQSKLLRLLKCDEMQGYRFSQPVPADKCVALIQNGGKFEVP